MPNSRLIQFFALAACGVLVFGASRWIPRINEGRKALDMMGAANPQHKAPPQYAFAIQALGAFRGLITDLAFIRAETYKEQGRFYDAKQLAEWICALQPHFPAVWEFAAWNLSWNISVTTYTPDERWQWVYNGVKLLRDQGIPYNPRAVNLYKQLAWTFNNKMGEITDDHHYTYKTNWAWRMHLVLGAPPPALGEVDPNTLANLQPGQMDATEDLLREAGRKTFELNEEKRRQAAEARGETYVRRSYEEVLQAASAGEEPASYVLERTAAYERIRTIALAPKKLDEVYAAAPEARGMVAALRELKLDLSDRELSEETYWSDHGLAFRFFEPYRRLTEPLGLLRRVTEETDREAARREQSEKLDAILGVRAGNPAGELLVRWLQRKVLREVYKLEPDHMALVVQKFGPVDWRSVDAHAIYWVTKGLIEGGETIDNFRNDKANTARILFFSLRNLFQRNRITFEPYPERIELSYLNLGQDLNFIESMQRAYLEYAPLFEPRSNAPGMAGEMYRVGHINFLTEAVQLLYLSGREQEADHYYAYLQRKYPTGEDGTLNPRLQKPLHLFVMDNFLETTKSSPAMRDARAAIGGLLYFAYSRLADGQVREYNTMRSRAHDLWREYMKDKQERISKPKQLPPFAEMEVDAFAAWFTEAPPMAPQQSLRKARLWHAAPPHLRQRTYDWLKPYFEVECDAWGFELAAAFPEPGGMEAYRLAHPERYRPPEAPLDTIDAETLPMKTGE